MKAIKNWGIVMVIESPVMLSEWSFMSDIVRGYEASSWVTVPDTH